MEIEDKQVARKEMGAAEPEAPLKKAPTLYLIIFFKLAKGVLACAFAVVLYFQSAKLLPVEYQDLLAQPVVVKLFHYLRIHPENKFFTRLAIQIANVTEAGVRDAAIGAVLWALFPLTEGIGLMFRVKWAGWLAIVESAFFVPVEIYELVKEFTWFMVGVAIINSFIVWYLYANRERLFHQHHHHHHPQG
jgi:uncharacterized membrane protein (DUF2068 family)